MAIRFGMSGGNFNFSLNPPTRGIWATVSNTSSVSNAPAGRNNTYAYVGNINTGQLFTPNLGGNYAGLIAGEAWYQPNGFSSGQGIITFFDNNGNSQCDVRMNASGQLYFTRNGTNLGVLSTQFLVNNSWSYVEFKAIFSTTGTGTCEVRVNNSVWLTLNSCTNATGVATGSVVDFHQNNGGYAMDFYALDTVSGVNTTYLGDITAAEVYCNGPGVNSQWTANVGPFALTSVNGTGVYQGTITGGGSNAYVGYNFNITGFVNGANNLVGGICTASTATSITFGGNTTITESATGSAAFQAIPQIGINQTGTRPSDDVAYISDSTAGHITDFAHQTLNLTGSIAAVIHQTYGRKDDAGTRQIQQVCISNGTVETSATINLNSSDTYYQDILEVDPHTSAAWGTAAFNAATFGVKEIT